MEPGGAASEKGLQGEREWNGLRRDDEHSTAQHSED